VLEKERSGFAIENRVGAQRAADLSTPVGRSRERFRRLRLTSAGSLAARGIGFATSFITVPLTVHYLGPERYGLWATLSSVIAMASFADFGLGNGLLNALSGAHGRDDRDEAAREVSTAFLLLLAVAATLGAVFLLAYPHIRWAGVYNVTSPEARAEAGPATAALVACFLANLPVAVVARVRQGYQEGYRTSLFDAAGNILGLLLVLLAIEARLPLVWLVLAMAGAPVVASLVHAIVLFGRDRPWLRVAPERFDRRTATRLLQHGGLFFVLQFAASFVYAPDNLIIAQTLGPTSVAHYAVAAKLFTVAVLLSDVALTPLWPAYGEAMARGDLEWVHRTLARSIQVAALASIVFASLFAVGGNEILSRWVGPDFRASLALRLGLGTWTIVMTIGMAVAMYLNAANHIRVQAVCAIVWVPASLVLKVMMVTRWGLAAVPWAMVVSYVAFAAVPLAALGIRGRLAPARPAAVP
jgi:O-antigen/teichoic acid export membrane protein